MPHYRQHQIVIAAAAVNQQRLVDFYPIPMSLSPKPLRPAQFRIKMLTSKLPKVKRSSKIDKLLCLSCARSPKWLFWNKINVDFDLLQNIQLNLWRQFKQEKFHSKWNFFFSVSIKNRKKRQQRKKFHQIRMARASDLWYSKFIVFFSFSFFSLLSFFFFFLVLCIYTFDIDLLWIINTYKHSYNPYCFVAYTTHTHTQWIWIWKFKDCVAFVTLAIHASWIQSYNVWAIPKI